MAPFLSETYQRTLVFFLGVAVTTAAAIPIDQQKTFGHSIKAGPLPANTEVTAFEHDCSIPPCVITLIHVPGIYPPSGEAWNWTHGILNCYIDDDSNNESSSDPEPTISLSLLELAGESRFNVASKGPMTDGGPWGIDLMGRTARVGGVTSTVRIPFQSHIRITIQAPDSAKGQSVYWMIVRGLEGHRVILGDLELPKSARLQVSKVPPTLVEEFDFSPPNHSGALLLVKLDATGTNFHYLEACMRLASLNDDNSTMYLSSGAEDYFLSAFYFDAGMFKTPNSGLTYFDKADAMVGAYKTHLLDPILFKDGFRLVFRNNEKTGDCHGFDCCPRHSPAQSSSTSSTPLTDDYLDSNQVEQKIARHATETSTADSYNRKSSTESKETNDGDPVTYSAVVWYYEWENSMPSASSSSSESSSAAGDEDTDVDPNDNRVVAAISRIARLGGSGLITADQEDYAVDRLVLDRDVNLLLLIEGIPSEESSNDAQLARHVRRYVARYTNTADNDSGGHLLNSNM